MKKSKLIIVCLASATAVAVAVLVVLAIVGFGKAGEASELADKAVSAVDKVYKRDPFPSQENIDRANANGRLRAEWTKALAEALDEGSAIPARGVTPGAFNLMREKAIENMAKSAPDGETGKRAIPENFAFGFKRYATGDPAKKVHVERLVRQLRLMEALVGILYKAGIVSFEGAGRESFEDASEDYDYDYAPGGRRFRGSVGASPDGDIAIPPLPAPSGAVPMQRDRFAFQFLAREASLVSILDAIDSMRPFAMVTSLSVEKVRSDVVFPEEKEAEKGGRGRDEGSSRRNRRNRRGSAEEAPEREAAPALNERPAPRSSRLVSGPLREAPVKVLMSVDVFSAPPERSRKAGSAGEDSGSGEED